ncbi:MAG: transcriptional regulator, Crp/Fnr family [Actinomycetia bacterium]|nr:transcriptional regulator, Crp/Fnr family [Actinomycetes bacterium]
MEWRLLAGVSAEDVRRLVAIAQRRTYRRGQVVFHYEDAADALHLVVAGHFAVRVTLPTGESVLLAIIGPGDAFGELALVSESGRGATVQAFSDGETLALHRDAFEALRRARPQVDRSLAEILAERLRRVNELLTEAHYVDADVRVRRRLLELGEGFDGTIPLTQEEIAQTAGTSRATVNRVLREEEAAGAVELGRGRTTITDAAALHARATR